MIDSEPFWRLAQQTTLKGYGHEITQEQLRLTMGRRSDEVARHWHAHFGLEITPEEFETEFVQKVIEQININGQELPGVQHVIKLVEGHKLPMAVASSSAPEVIDAVLEKLGLKKHIKLAYSAKYEEFGKPHPAVFISTAKKLEVEPVNCLVFEDSKVGVKAAKTAGMKCVAVPSEEDKESEEIKIADLVVDSLGEINWEKISHL